MCSSGRDESGIGKRSGQQFTVEPARCQQVEYGSPPGTAVSGTDGIEKFPAGKRPGSGGRDQSVPEIRITGRLAIPADQPEAGQQRPGSQLLFGNHMEGPAVFRCERSRHGQLPLHLGSNQFHQTPLPVVGVTVPGNGTGFDDEAGRQLFDPVRVRGD